MKRRHGLVMVAALALLGSGLALAAEPVASIEQGKALFNDTALGTSGKSCNTCHPDGKGLEEAEGGDYLVETINTCIENPLKGQPLAHDSVAMQSLVLYIRSLAK